MIFIDRKGNQIPLSGYYTVQYRDMDIGGAWTSLDYQHNGATLDQIGFTTRLNLPYAMRPEIRMRQRYPIGKNELEFRDTLQWYGLRSQLQAPTSYAGVTVLAVRYRSSDRISAQTESRISVEATRMLPTRQGGAWTTELATRDIVPFLCYIAKERGYTDADLDLEELDRLDAIWKSRGDTFDMIYEDGKVTVAQIMDDVLAAGYAEKTIKRGVISAARDEPRTTFGHMYSPQSMDGPRGSASALRRRTTTTVLTWISSTPTAGSRIPYSAACPAMSAGRSRRSRLSVSQTAIGPGAMGCAVGWRSDTGEPSIRSIPASMR